VVKLYLIISSMAMQWPRNVIAASEMFLSLDCTCF